MARKQRSNKSPRRSRRGKDIHAKLAVGQVGGIGAAVAQGQLHRRMVASGNQQVQRVVAVVCGLGGIAATIMGNPAAGATLMGPANGQAAIESSLVDIIPASKP